ncbi:MAG TPA: DUF4105 domain-containing protein [Pseudacidobacterium sp.]|jgi:hypothetical protein|nr:DUF4105 domain-containing protein [Pseudacidobacterium sp.]
MGTVPVPQTNRRGIARKIAHAFVYLLLLLLTAWAVAALYFDVRFAWLRLPAIVLYLGVVIWLALRCRRFWRRVQSCIACFLVVLGWWLSLKPSNDGNWQTDVSRLAYGSVNGDQVTIYNMRSCDYRAEFDYTCQWLTREVDLNQIRGVDIFLDYWGSPWIAHTILSFDVGNGQHIAFSIEARKHVGQSYSAIRGFFRQFTLISIVSDERDVVRLRTNYRQNENLYLYHTRATPGFARALFLDYIHFTNALHDRPQWYNAATHNCTTEIFALRTMRSQPRNWTILLNGKGDEAQYRDGNIAGDGLPFDELKRRAYINPAAKAADKDPDFSEQIRENRPGFK